MDSRAPESVVAVFSSCRKTCGLVSWWRAAQQEVSLVVVIVLGFVTSMAAFTGATVWLIRHEMHPG